MDKQHIHFFPLFTKHTPSRILISEYAVIKTERKKILFSYHNVRFLLHAVDSILFFFSLVIYIFVAHMAYKALKWIVLFIIFFLLPFFSFFFHSFMPKLGKKIPITSTLRMKNTVLVVEIFSLKKPEKNINYPY